MTGVPRIFDPVAQQSQLNTSATGLKWYPERDREVRTQARTTCWSQAKFSYVSVAVGHICGADDTLLREAGDTIAGWASLSLERQEWRGYEQVVADDGSVTSEDWPSAYIAANLVLLRDRWLRTAVISHVAVTTMFAQPMSKPAVQGVMDEIEIVPLSAWSQIRQLRDMPYQAEGRRISTPGRRIGQKLAEDPSQLHDPRSPVRKSARKQMQTSMATRWLATGLGVEAMNWLWTFEWREGESGLTPHEVMLRAYAYMPDVEAPPNIAAEVEQLRLLQV